MKREKDNRFSWREWNVPRLVPYHEIKDKIDSFQLIGRTILGIRAIGCSYEHIRDDIENLSLERRIEIDEPLLIRFCDGDQFEVVTGLDPEYVMGMNTLSWFIRAGINSPTVNAGIVFAPCIGCTIERIEYVTEMDGPFEDSEEEIEIVDELILWLSNGMGLRITSMNFDYCYIELIDEKKKSVTMSLEELREAKERVIT